MKKTIGIVLLSLYLLTVLRPFLPYVEYWINYDYIVNVLCINKDKKEVKCNGKCHLQKQLAEASESGDSTDKALPQVKLENFPMICTMNQYLQSPIAEKECQLLSTYFFHAGLFSPQPPSPPPKSIKFYRT